MAPEPHESEAGASITHAVWVLSIWCVVRTRDPDVVVRPFLWPVTHSARSKSHMQRRHFPLGLAGPGGRKPDRVLKAVVYTPLHSGQHGDHDEPRHEPIVQTPAAKSLNERRGGYISTTRSPKLCDL